MLEVDVILVYLVASDKSSHSTTSILWDMVGCRRAFPTSIGTLGGALRIVQKPKE
ncbi:MAG: hypothetical protein QW154_00230 [Sulfolobales archaeon]